jgi:hypothetical protein
MLAGILMAAVHVLHLKLAPVELAALQALDAGLILADQMLAEMPMAVVHVLHLELAPVELVVL